MLRNVAKYRAFSRAFTDTVRGKDVLEIGTGSGVLALLCALHGARSVVAVERGPMAVVASAAFAAFPTLGNRITLITDDFFDANLKRDSFDVILSETIGYLGFEEGISDILYGAANDYAWPGTSLIPSTLELVLEPIDHFDGPLPANPHLRFVGRNSHRLELLKNSGPFVFGSAPYPENPIITTWRFAQPGTILAIAPYFSAPLGNGASISNQEATHWPRCVIPLAEPLQGYAGDELQLFLLCERGNPLCYSFTVRASMNRRQVSELKFNATQIDGCLVKQTREPLDPYAAVCQLINALADEARGRHGGDGIDTPQ